MTGRLLSIFGRTRVARRLMVVAFTVVTLSVVASALTPAPRPGHGRGLSPKEPTRSVQAPPGPRRPAPVPAGELARARDAAARFLAGYVPFIYGRGSARSVDAIAPALRLQLMRARAQVTPVERRRRPRVVALTAVGRAPGVVLATALVADGGVTTYALRITLREDRSGWLASAVDGG
jgi:hypothetical protein